MPSRNCEGYGSTVDDEFLSVDLTKHIITNKTTLKLEMEAARVE
jgi:hypothetical protein